MTRSDIARELRVPLATLRNYENAALLPRFGPAVATIYADRVRLLVAARKCMSMQRVRTALALGGR